MQNLIIDFIIFCVITRYIIERRGRGSPHPTYTVFNSNSECKLESYDILVSPSQFLHMYAIPMTKNSNLRFKHSSPFTYTLLKNNNACLYYYILRCQTFILIVWSIIAHFIKFSFIYTVYEMHLTISQIKMHNYPLLFLCILNSVFVAYYIIWM